MNKIGDCFKISYNNQFEYYMLAQVEAFMVELISLENGNRFDNAFEVINSMDIPDYIIKQMIKSDEINYSIEKVTRTEAFQNSLKSS